MYANAGYAELSKTTITFQPLGIVKPAKVNSVKASLKPIWAGGASLIASHTTFQVYLILLTSSQFSNSPVPLDSTISITSENIKTKP